MRPASARPAAAAASGATAYHVTFALHDDAPKVIARPASAYPSRPSALAPTTTSAGAPLVSAMRSASPSKLRPASAAHMAQTHDTSSGHARPASAHVSSMSGVAAEPGRGSPAASPRSLGPASIPVRHTKRTGELASRQAAAAALEAGPPPVKVVEWTEASVRAHYDPMLSTRETKLVDLRARFSKQTARLVLLQGFKSKALDHAQSEPNPLDYVLGPDGSKVESQRVRGKRVALQRTLIRQFLRTFRLLRGLKVVHRHLRTMLPLLVDSPNSQLEPQTRMLLKDVISGWNREPVPGSGSSKKAGRYGFEGDAHVPPRPLTPDISKMSPDAARKAQEYLFYRQHPHSFTSKLLANLFDVVPLLRQGVIENLRAKREIDEANYDAFLASTTLVHTVASSDRQIEERRATIQHLRDDVDLLERELRHTRDSYSTTVDDLESLMRREHVLLRKLNQMYYREVSDKLGEPYAVQLSMLQQGQPYTAVIGPPPSGAYPSNSSPDHPAISQLFLPNTLHGANLPAPPATIPTFLSSGTSSGGMVVAATTIPLTASSPQAAATRTRAIHKHLTLLEVDHVLDQHPDHPHNVELTRARAREDQKRVRREVIKVATQTVELEDDEDEEDDCLAHGVNPFFVLHSHEPAEGDRPADNVDVASNGSGEPSHSESEAEEDDEEVRAADEEAADQVFFAQRDHFRSDTSLASRSDAVEEKEAASAPTATRRPHSAVQRDPLLHAPGARIAPLHTRTISEIDWQAQGPLDPSVRRKKHLTPEEREAKERADRLTNPFILFEKTDEDAAKKKDSAAVTPQVSFDASAPGGWFSQQAISGGATPTPKTRRPASAASMLPPSPVPGMSREAYHASFQAAVASLHKLGYPSGQAEAFAPHLVLAGVVQAPAPKVEQVTEPTHVSAVAQRRLQKRVGSFSSQVAASVPQQQPPPVSEELAWISGMPSSDPYAVAPASAQTSRPSSGVNRPGMNVGIFSARPPSASSSATRPPAARPGSAAPRVGHATSKHVRSFSAAPSPAPFLVHQAYASAARTNALSVGMPSDAADYRPTPPQSRPPAAARRATIGVARRATPTAPAATADPSSGFLLSPR